MSYFNDDEAEIYESDTDSLKEEEYVSKKKSISIPKDSGINEELDDELDDDLEDDIEDDLDYDLDDDKVAQYGGVDVDDDEVEEEEEEEDEEESEHKKKKINQLPENIVNDYDDEDEDGELYLKKFDKDITQNYIMKFHPECVSHNYDEIEAFTKIVRDKNGIVIDDLHKTIPYLTKYERTRILGQRAKQINAGATPFVKVPENIIDGYLIAELELQQKRIPFIIRRPLPNGGSEYWNVKDLENISF